MRKYYLSSFLILFLVFSSSILNAQVKVEKSSIKKTIDGVEYYMHTVQQGHTAFNISKAYSISLEDIYSSNPGSDQKIDLGQVLLIPTRPLPVKVGQIDKVIENKPLPEDSFTFYTVKQGETLFRICQMYRVKDSVLIKYNPGIENGVKTSQQIKIPAIYKAIVLEEKPIVETKTETKVETKTEPKNVETQPKKEEKVGSGCLPIKSNKTYKIAVMMPFYTNLDNINIDNQQMIEHADKYKSFQFIQYYEGLLLAADSLAKMGMKIEIYPYDTKADSNVTRALLKNKEFEDFDIIFGPFFTYNQRIVLNHFKGKKTIIINPFSKDMSLVSDNQNMFKMEPEYTHQVFQMTQWIEDSMPKANILMIHNGKEDELKNINELKKNFALVGIPADQIKVFSYKEDGLGKLTNALRKDRQNILINVVNNEATITNFVRQMNNLVKTYDITVFGSENRWENFTMLEKEYLSNLKLLQFSTNFIDYQRPDVQHFVSIFAEKYLTDPKEIAFVGFDQGFYFLSMMHLFGTDFTDCMKDVQINTMTTDYTFEKVGNNAWQNKFVNVYQYQNFKLIDKRRSIPVEIKN